MTARVLLLPVFLLAVVTTGASPLAQTAATSATARAVAAAEKFLASLDPAQRAKANIGLDAKTRTIWSNLPTGIAMQVGAAERNGLKFGAMTKPQEQAALDVLSAVLSPTGFQKVMDIVDADQVLEERSASARKPGAAIRFGRAEYYLGLLGRPSTTTPWMIQFGGHHLAINVTLVGAANVLAPTHTGAQPASFTLAGRSIRPLGDENDKAFALINALDEPQRKQAILGTQALNLVLGPGTDGKMIAPEGVRASTFNNAQGTMLAKLVREWVDILGPEAAASKMKDVQAGLGETYFAWAGPTTNGRGAYFRIQGPSVFIEYAPQGQGDNNIDHIHTIYRDPTNDYAARLLRP